MPTGDQNNSNNRNINMSHRRHNSDHNIVALDIGATKVVAAIAAHRSNEFPGFDLLGVGQAFHRGVRQGAIIDIEATSQAISEACEKAETMSGQEIHSVWLGIGGTDISSFESSGIVPLHKQEVTEHDIQKVMDVAQATVIPNNHCILHALPKSYKVDHQSGVRCPLGMAGKRLEAAFHLITVPETLMQNFVRCTQRAGLKISGFVLQSLASSLAVINEDEKAMGVAVADMGGETCDLVIYDQGSLVHASSIPLGGKNFTSDLARGLRIKQTHAEELKRHWGCTLPDVEYEEKDLLTILEARSEEVLSLLRNALQEASFMDPLGAGIVITGGGSHLQGFIEMGSLLFDMPIRQGLPPKWDGFVETTSGSFATAIGILCYGHQEQRRRKKRDQKDQRGHKRATSIQGGIMLWEKCTTMGTKVNSYFSKLF